MSHLISISEKQSPVMWSPTYSSSCTFVSGHTKPACVGLITSIQSIWPVWSTIPFMWGHTTLMCGLPHLSSQCSIVYCICHCIGRTPKEAKVHLHLPLHLYNIRAMAWALYLKRITTTLIKTVIELIMSMSTSRVVYHTHPHVKSTTSSCGVRSTLL